MSNLIGGIRAPETIVDEVSLGGKTQPSAAGGFAKVFEQAVSRVEQFQKDSQTKVDSLLRGEDQEVHDVVLAAQRAELSFEYFLQVRNKVVSAYQEIMRMQM
ncbi:MAG: flagellar hook-basal body complex protein FliE [Bryobacterales bacterium]|nr:flagellar hook-basal body complex protein FliE [Bryobacterales bacterium]